MIGPLYLRSCDNLSHAFFGSVPLLQVLLLLPTNDRLNLPVKLPGGGGGGVPGGPGRNPTKPSLTCPEGQLFASYLGGQQFASQCCTHTDIGTGFSCQHCLTASQWFFLSVKCWYCTIYCALLAFINSANSSLNKVYTCP